MTNTTISEDLAEFFKGCQSVHGEKIKWGEMDAFQHLNNVHYFRFQECARIASFEQIEMMVHESNKTIGPILAETGCKYIAPVVYPDTLWIGIKTTDIKSDRFTQQYVIISESQKKLVAKGYATIVSYDYKNKCKAEIPESWKEALLKQNF